MTTEFIIKMSNDNIATLAVYLIEYGQRIKKYQDKIKEMQFSKFYQEHPWAIRIYETLLKNAEDSYNQIERHVESLKASKYLLDPDNAYDIARDDEIIEEDE